MMLFWLLKCNTRKYSHLIGPLHQIPSKSQKLSAFKSQIKQRSLDCYMKTGVKWKGVLFAELLMLKKDIEM